MNLTGLHAEHTHVQISTGKQTLAVELSSGFPLALCYSLTPHTHTQSYCHSSALIFIWLHSYSHLMFPTEIRSKSTPLLSVCVSLSHTHMRFTHRPPWSVGLESPWWSQTQAALQPCCDGPQEVAAAQGGSIKSNAIFFHFGPYVCVCVCVSVCVRADVYGPLEGERWAGAPNKSRYSFDQREET